MSSMRGSLVLESLLVSSAFFLMVTLQFELTRRVFFELALHHSAFFAVRSKVLSFDTGPRQRVCSVWRGFFGGKVPLPNVSFETFERQTVARVYAEWDSFARFPLPVGKKNRFEVARKCRFAFLR